MPLPNRQELVRFLACAILALAAASADAGEGEDDGKGEPENARRAVERGEALPLADILTRLRADLGGEITRVSFKREHGVWVYEFKVVEPEGRLVELYVDAASGRILEREAD